MVEFWVDGTPAPQGSKRAFHHAATGKIIMAESSAKVKPWRQAVASAARDAMAGNAPTLVSLRMVAVFYFPRPMSHFNSKGALKPNAPAWVAKMPDLSKLQRSTEDAMTGIVYRDDAQIVQLDIRKLFANPGQSLGARISIRPTD